MESLIGQPLAKKILLGLKSSLRLPQVLLFSGPEGVGKKLFAASFAKQILKIRPGDPDPHPDILILRPEGKLGLHPMESIRRFLKEAALPPYVAEKRVFIIEDADKMLPTSANALLKCLEEPFARTHIILTTGNKPQILSTILSRCLQVPFTPLSDSEVASFLESLKDIPKEKQVEAVQRSHGSLGKALAFLKESDENKRAQLLIHENIFAPFSSFYTYLERFFELLEKEKQKVVKKLTGVEEKEAESMLYFFERERFRQVLESTLFWFRDLEALFLQQKPFLYHRGDAKALQERVERAEKIPFPIVEKASRRAWQHFDMSGSPKLLLERFFLEIHAACR